MTWPKTEHSCTAAFCEEAIRFADEIYMLTVEVAVPTNDGKITHSPLVANDEDFMYEPVFYCAGCWQSIIEDLREIVDNTPPVGDAQSVIECSICRSGIRSGEVFSKVTFGEFRSPDRNPEGSLQAVFCTLGKPSIICAPCINTLGENISEIWGDPVKQNNECTEGTHKRCWRYGCSADINHKCMCEEE
jgi:hypothetical protein